MPTGGAMEAELTRALFEVRVPGVLAGEEVRVSGSEKALGRWALQSSVALKRKPTDEEVWHVCVELPASSTVDYRYLVVQPLQRGALRVLRWENTVRCRTVCLSGPSPDNEQDHEAAPLVKEDGLFGQNGVGNMGMDRGWLVGTSELQLQLHASEGPPIRFDLRPPEQCYNVRVQYRLRDEPDVCEAPFCTPVVAKVLHRAEGSCSKGEQGPHGVPYSEDTVVVFSTEAASFSSTAFVVDIFSSPPPSGSPELVGRAGILPQHLSSASSGRLTLTVLSPGLTPIGTVSFSFLLIHPVRDAPQLLRMPRSCAARWQDPGHTLHIGHRGLGDSFDHARAGPEPAAMENTIKSLKMAGAHGADYVEFDVQLSKDLVPVIYHDFVAKATLAQQVLSTGELHKVFLKDLTLSQLHSLKLDHASTVQATPGPERRCEEESRLSDSTDPESKICPTLEEVLRMVPPHVGFNIEVKYPVPEQDNTTYSFDYFDLNVMADSILRVVSEHAGERKVIFSCFNPDMCTMLRRKQPTYPVLYLYGDYVPYWSLDVRARTVKDIVAFAVSESLMGVNLFSTNVLREPELVPWIKTKNLVLFTWGDEGCDDIIKLKELGVAAIIYDRIANRLGVEGGESSSVLP